jgi:hypothetical protein
MSTPTPALDFCRKISIWQEAEGASAGLPMLIPDRERNDLASILAEASWKMHLDPVEDRARRWLVGYRELEDQQRVLTAAQRAELNAIVDQLTAGRPVIMLENPLRGRRAVFALAALLIAVLIVITSVWLVRKGSAGNPAPAAGAAAPARQQQVPAGTTDLENFKRDWAPFTQLAVDEQHPQTRVPALLFLENGGYYVTQWQVLPSDPAWSPDLGGNITAADVRGNWVLVTDADGNDWVVGTGQPFVIARNPGTVLEVDEAGTVLSMPESHAVASDVRHHI